jgi:lipopolysaccharide export system protein LptA
MTAARTLVDYTNNGSLKIKLINSTGGVVVTRNNESAVGDVGTYDFDRRVIVMSGNVTLRRGTDVSHGARLVVDLNTGLTNFVGGAALRRGDGADSGPCQRQLLRAGQGRTAVLRTASPKASKRF